MDIGVPNSRANVPGRRLINVWRPALATGVVALLIILATVLNFQGPWRDATEEMPPFSLLTTAWAAEEALFAGDRIVHIVNEIVVPAVSNPVLAQARWFPVMAVEATGKARVHQLSLPASPGERYTVDDQAWYDPAKGRFVRLLSLNGTPLFANSYDGAVV